MDGRPPTSPPATHNTTPAARWDRGRPVVVATRDGLLFDLLATGDRDRHRAAAKSFIANPERGGLRARGLLHSRWRLSHLCPPR